MHHQLEFEDGKKREKYIPHHTNGTHDNVNTTINNNDRNGSKKTKQFLFFHFLCIIMDSIKNMILYYYKKNDV